MTPCLPVPLWSHPSEHPQSSLTARTHRHTRTGREKIDETCRDPVVTGFHSKVRLSPAVLGAGVSHLNKWWIQCWRSLSTQRHPREEERHETSARHSFHYSPLPGYQSTSLHPASDTKSSHMQHRCALNTHTYSSVHKTVAFPLDNTAAKSPLMSTENVSIEDRVMFLSSPQTLDICLFT